MRYIDVDKLHYTRVFIPQKDGTVSGMLHAAVLSSEIKDAPTANVQEIKHGKWMKAFSSIFKWESKDNSEKGFYTATCSNCNISQSVMTYQGKIKFNFCPYCGAKMDGK